MLLYQYFYSLSEDIMKELTVPHIHMSYTYPTLPPGELEDRFREPSHAFHKC
jgi:hypothetical protein